MTRCHRTVWLPRRFLPWLLNGSLLLRVLLSVSQAQVPTAITPDSTLGTTVTQRGNVYDITGGTRPGRGPNLFHSFDRFSVGTNDTARFSGPTGIENIVSRVTGGQQSVIDGRLQSTIPGANLYLLNPRGVLFGPQATLDISGSFHVSTADVLRFADGATFSAHLGEKSTLTVASPSAFGFLGPNPAPIFIQKSSLQVSQDNTVSVVGGDITLVGDAARTAAGVPTLGAPGGRIHLVSVAAPGEVGVHPSAPSPALQVDNVGRHGTVTIADLALIDASGAGGGTVVIRSGRLMIDSSLVFADTLRHLNGVKIGIDIVVTGDVMVTNGSLVTTDSIGAGNAGAIWMDAARVTVSGGAQIRSITTGPGQGGNVTVRATEAVTVAGTSPVRGAPSVIGAQAQGTGTGAGAAGDILVEAATVTVTGGAQMASATSGPGRGGNVTVRATEAVTVAGTNPLHTFPSVIGAQALGLDAGAGAAGNILVEAATVTVTDGAAITGNTTGPGRGGGVTVRATEAVRLAGTNPVTAMPSGIGSNALGAGAAGAVTVHATHVTITDGAAITGSTTGPGRGGGVTVRATEAVWLTGTSSRGTPSGIAAEARGTGAGAGAAGDMLVAATTVTVTDGAVISSTTAGPGRGGSVTVRATEAVTVAGTNPVNGSPGGIAAQAQGSGGGAGAAGDILVEAATVRVTDGAAISGTTDGPGRGGSVTVRAMDMVAISGPASGLFTGTAGSGTGGDIALHAPQIQLTDGAAVSAESLGMGNAGSITMVASDTFRSRHSTVTTATRQADGGNITLQAASLVQLRDSQLTTTVQGGEGRGGNVTIDPRFVILERSQIRADAAGGPGGNVRISAEVFLADPASRITASSARNVPGEINIQAAITNVSGLVAPFAPDFASAAVLLHDPCAARLHEGTVSSFVVRERVSLPATYDDILPTRLYELQWHQGPPPGAGHPSRETTAAPQARYPVAPPEPSQDPNGSASTRSPLRLDLPCARP